MNTMNSMVLKSLACIVMREIVPNHLAGTLYQHHSLNCGHDRVGKMPFREADQFTLRCCVLMCSS